MNFWKKFKDADKATSGHKKEYYIVCALVMLIYVPIFIIAETYIGKNEIFHWVGLIGYLIANRVAFTLYADKKGFYHNLYATGA